MKVVFVITKLKRGGAEGQLISIAKGLGERMHEISVVSLAPIVSFSDLDNLSGIRLFSVLGSPIEFLTAGLKKVFCANVICAFLFHADVFVRILGVFLPWSVKISSYRSQKFGGRIRTYFLKYSEFLVTRIVVNSQVALESLVSEETLSLEKSLCIPNLYKIHSINKNSSTTRNNLNINKNSFVWIIVARLVPAKNHSMLIDVFSSLKNSVLLIVGDGESRSLLEMKVAKDNLQDRIIFLGEREDVSDLLLASDAFVLTSFWEGMPNAIIEAMRLSLPIVATNVGGVSELVHNNRNGYLVPSNDTNSLLGAMQAIEDLNTNSRKMMGDWGYQYTERMFSKKNIIDKWEELFLSELDKKGSKIKEL